MNSEAEKQEAKIELLLCPFCGSQAQVATTLRSRNPDDKFWFVYCTNGKCGIETDQHTRQWVIDFWNSRSSAETGEAGKWREMVDKMKYFAIDEAVISFDTSGWRVCLEDGYLFDEGGNFAKFDSPLAAYEALKEKKK